MRVFNYSSDLQLDSKSVSGIYNKVMKRDYSTSGFNGQYVGMHIGLAFCGKIAQDTVK
jgi:hypothetical protein